MENSLNYFDFAENDYLYLKYSYESGIVANNMCYTAQNVCERYLKHLIDVLIMEEDTTRILRTHSLAALKNYMEDALPDFVADWGKILPADGYYYSTRYPGENALIAKRSDIEFCWAAVQETRTATLLYLERIKMLPKETRSLNIEPVVKDKFRKSDDRER